MNDNFDEPKLSKFKLSSLIVSPIPKKVLSFSNNDNLRAATKPDQFLSSQNINNPEDSSNIQKFILHKNSAFRSPNWKSSDSDENKPNIMSLKIPDFIVEDQKERENIHFNKSNSENETDNFWNQISKPQPFIKDYLLQECFASLHPFQRQLFYDADQEKPKIQPRKDSCHSETLSEKRKIPVIKKTKACNCKKTKCLKLYCECFSGGEMCGPYCNCTGCYNNINQSKVRSEAIETILEKQPEAFTSKYKALTSKEKLAHKKGCNCKKSYCLKKYCECFTAGILCTDQCRCEDCRNINPDLSEKSKKKIKLNSECQEKKTEMEIKLF